MQIRYCSSRGTKISYRIAGREKKPAVVLIHGAAGDSRLYEGQINALGEAFTVIAPDLPAHGRSEHKEIPRLDDYVDAVMDVLSNENADSAVIAGHSMGGGIALEIYKRHPARVEGLIFVSAAAVLPVSQVVFDVFDQDYAAFCGFLVKLSYGRGASEELKKAALEELDRMDRGVIKNDFVICNGFDYRPMLSDIKVPCLIMANRNDKMVPGEYVRELADGISDSTLIIYDTEGHMPFLENTDQVNRDITSFITGRIAP